VPIYLKIYPAAHLTVSTNISIRRMILTIVPHYYTLPLNGSQLDAYSVVEYTSDLQYLFQFIILISN
jgi:hypothetical protein